VHLFLFQRVAQSRHVVRTIKLRTLLRYTCENEVVGGITNNTHLWESRIHGAFKRVSQSPDDASQSSDSRDAIRNLCRPWPPPSLIRA